MSQSNFGTSAVALMPSMPAIDRLPPALRIDDATLKLLQCPNCAGDLALASERFDCQVCGAEFPVSHGVPILVVPQKSIFDIETFTNQDPTFFRPVGKLREFFSRYIPDVSMNVSSAAVYDRMRDHLLANTDRPTVLVIGGGVIGGGMDSLINDPRIRFIETDVAVAPRTKLICDGHDLPFQDQSVDAVIVQAVLEHVVDPYRCVAEIHRVLKPNGLVYSDTPFIQQVHGRQFDFTRFTRLGHRRLFRNFKEMESGISCGPGVALAWTARYFLLSCFQNQSLRAAASLLARLTLWPLKYVDRVIAKKDSALDAASAFYFLGQRSDTTFSDRELINSYKGGF